MDFHIPKNRLHCCHRNTLHTERVYHHKLAHIQLSSHCQIVWSLFSIPLGIPLSIPFPLLVILLFFLPKYLLFFGILQNSLWLKFRFAHHTHMEYGYIHPEAHEYTHLTILGCHHQISLHHNCLFLQKNKLYL